MFIVNGSESIVLKITGTYPLGKWCCRDISGTSEVGSSYCQLNVMWTVFLQSVLLVFVNENPALQMEAIYAVQVFCHKNGFPKGKSFTFLQLSIISPGVSCRRIRNRKIFDTMGLKIWRVLQHVKLSHFRKNVWMFRSDTLVEGVHVWLYFRNDTENVRQSVRFGDNRWGSVSSVERTHQQ